MKRSTDDILAALFNAVNPESLESYILNKVEAIASAQLINKLTKDRKEKIKVVIDCPSPNRDSWKGYVMKKVLDSKNLTVACEHKADRDYIAVGAASILAKSEREKAIKKLRTEVGDFGSWYPNDPKTKDFLVKFGKKYAEKGLFRETWATFKNHNLAKKQKKLFEF